MPDIFQNINQTIRSKYELVYRPSNAKQDGTYRKLRVELVDDGGTAAALPGREEEAAEVRHHCAGRIQGQAGSGVRQGSATPASKNRPPGTPAGNRDYGLEKQGPGSKD